MENLSKKGLDSCVRVGISSCLLGEAVRFDGGHKKDRYITETLGRYFDFVPICPEVAIGLGIPRESIRLVKQGGDIKAAGVRNTALDVTSALEQFGHETASGLTYLSGYLLKRGSPSCGMERVKVYSQDARPSGNSRGVYARVLMECQPLLPVEEEGRLADPVLRENFIERVFIYNRWQSLVAGGLTPAALVDFQALLI